MRTPTISFIICTLNCRDYLERCLKSIRNQDYPQNKVEIVIVDSYSTDGTLEVAKSHKARIILTKKRGYMEGKGMPKSIGCEKARGEIIITIDSDNALVEKDWIKKTTYPLMTDKNVNLCISRQALVKTDPLINQYLALVGTDPFAIYTSIDPQISFGNIKLKDKGKYYTYDLDLNNFFILGGYYLTIKKETLMKIGGYTRDVDVIYALIENGLGKIAIPKEAHLHHLITKGFNDFFRKKMKWGKYYFSNPQLQSKRKFKWASGLYGKSGKIRFIYEVLRNLMFFPAFFVSLKMLIKDRHKAWLMHPLLKFSTTIAYLSSYIKTK